MKKLSLYIDKWYIIGALNTDGVIRLLRLPNGEDRVWLYFHENVESDEISYSKAYEQNYRDNQNHYHGDVFSQIVSKSAKYVMFNHRQDMIGIFKSAKIFDDIRRDIEEDREVETYVSFSKDISLAARQMFLEVLDAECFVVKESAARIEHLALEYAAKKGDIPMDGHYLVLNACNENLHYSMYQKSEELFVRASENTLPGLGTDVRIRALIEQIIDSINKREGLLKSKEEKEREYLRMTQYADDWVAKLQTARGAIPVTITGITFSADRHRDYSVPVLRKKVEERTSAIVRDIVRAITTFVKQCNVRHEQVAGIVLIGNTLTNQQFRNEFLNHYDVGATGVLSYLDKDLASLVNAYTLIDCTQFSAETSNLRASAEAELQRLRLAEEEAEARRKAQEEADRIGKQRHEESEAKRKYGEAMQRGYDSETSQNYDEMAEYFAIALSFRPHDEEASRKYNDALRKKAETTVRVNNYKERFGQAKAALENGDWETAKQKSEEALGFMPDSKEAQKIKDTAIRRIKQAAAFERYLDRADLFVAQKAYDEALKELDKAKHLEVGSEESAQIKERERKISSEKRTIENKIDQLSKLLSAAVAGGRFEEAISCCNQLAEVDFANSRKWMAKMADIKARQEEQKKTDETLKALTTAIDAAQWDEDWPKMVELCRQALAIREDKSLREKLSRAQAKTSEKEAQNQLDCAIHELKDLILHGEFARAKQLLNQLGKATLNSAYHTKIRELRSLLFVKEDEAETSKLAKLKGNLPDFFQETKPKASGLTNRAIGFLQPQPRKKAATDGGGKSKDDFFGETAIRKKQTNKVGGITNDDFNF